MITVSVIIPSYNHAPYIGKAVQSVLDQSFTDYELLISDDCSEDNSLTVLERYRNHPHVTLFEQKRHLGAVEQIHFLAQHACGKYIALLNSDDFWLPQKLSKQVSFMEAHPEIDACFTHTTMVDEFDREITKKQFEHHDIFIQPNRSRIEWLSFFLSNGNALAHPSVLARRGLYEGTYRLNPALRQLPDYDLWTRFMLQHEIHVLQEPLTVHRRINGQNTSAQTKMNTALLYREQAWIRSKLIESLSDEDFCTIFRAQFRKPYGPDTNILCEKFFAQLCMSENDAAMLERTIDFFLSHADDAMFVQQMADQYGYTDRDFFSLVQQSRIVQYVCQEHAASPSLLRRLLCAIRGRWHNRIQHNVQQQI